MVKQNMDYFEQNFQQPTSCVASQRSFLRETNKSLEAKWKKTPIFTLLPVHLLFLSGHQNGCRTIFCTIHYLYSNFSLISVDVISQIGIPMSLVIWD